MSCSQEFVQAQLEERRRTSDHLRLLHSARSTRQETEEQVSGPSRSLLGSARHHAIRAARRCLTWLSASQLGPLSDADPLDVTRHRH